MTPEQIIKQWGNDSLMRFPDALLDTVDLPLETKEFLKRVGFPKRFPVFGGLMYEVFPVSSDSRSTERGLLKRLSGSEFLLLARCEMQDRYIVCIREGVGTVGFVGVTPTELDGNLLFVNSNVQAFLEFQLIWTSFTNPEDDDSTFTQAMVRKLERRLERIDPAAFGEDGTYWLTVSEDFTNQWVTGDA